MTSPTKRAAQKGLTCPPKWLPESLQYETVMGSVAYGVSNDMSDCDVYGFCIPPKHDVFPHLAGHIPGFGKQQHRFGQWQEHHVHDKESRREYDFSIYGIVKYFDLCMGGNPNMVDSLFTPRRCVLFSTQIGEMVRSDRRLFLSKKVWHTFKGYAYSQMKKIRDKKNHSNPARAASIKDHGYDVKFGYHLVRLMFEAEQILLEEDLDLERNREQLKVIRRGEWDLDYLFGWFYEKERVLEQVYVDSRLRRAPDQDQIKELLMRCLEQYYGSIGGAVRRDTSVDSVLADLQEVIRKHGG